MQNKNSILDCISDFEPEIKTLMSLEVIQTYYSAIQ